MKTARSGRRGLSLLEVEVSLLIFMFGVVALMAFPSTLQTGSRFAEQRVQGAFIAQHLLEQELANSYLYELGPSSSWTDLSTSQFPGLQTEDKYQYRVLRADHPVLGPSVRIITLEVRHLERDPKRNGTYQTYAITGYKANSQ